MTDCRCINSLFNQQTVCPACRLSNKIWRPWPGANLSESVVLGAVARSRHFFVRIAPPPPPPPRTNCTSRSPTSIGRPRSVISAFAEFYGFTRPAPAKKSAKSARFFSPLGETLSFLASSPKDSSVAQYILRLPPRSLRAARENSSRKPFARRRESNELGDGRFRVVPHFRVRTTLRGPPRLVRRNGKRRSKEGRTLKKKRKERIAEIAVIVATPGAGCFLVEAERKCPAISLGVFPPGEPGRTPRALIAFGERREVDFQQRGTTR